MRSEIHLAINKTCHFLSKDGEVEGNSENVTESDVYIFKSSLTRQKVVESLLELTCK